MTRRGRERGPAWWSECRDGHGHFRRERPGSGSRGRHFRELEWMFSSGGLAPGCPWGWVRSQDQATCACVWHSEGGLQTLVADFRICIQPPASDWSCRCPFPRWEQDESIQTLLLSNFLPSPAPTRGPRFCMVSPTANFPPGRPENYKLEAKRLM